MNGTPFSFDRAPAEKPEAAGEKGTLVYTFTAPPPVPDFEYFGEYRGRNAAVPAKRGNQMETKPFSLPEFAKTIKATLVYPSPARHVRSMYEKADVKRTWALYGPEEKF